MGSSYIFCAYIRMALRLPAVRPASLRIACRRQQRRARLRFDLQTKARAVRRGQH